MVPSARKAIACILLIFGAAVYSQSQTGPTKETTASISGKVTSKGKGVQGVGVIASLTNSNGPVQGGSYRGTTDLDGKYRITNLAAGTYRLDLFAPTFVPENVDTNSALVVADGETVENVNFAMLRGGVITGKITNSDGQPVIAESVFIVLTTNTCGTIQETSSRTIEESTELLACGLQSTKFTSVCTNIL